MRERPAYVLIGVTIHGDPSGQDVEGRKEYGRLAGKLLRELELTIDVLGAGSKASGNLQLLTGEYPFGTLVLERYSSMKKLSDFWASGDYQAAREIRSGFSFRDIHFMVAFDSIAPALEGDSTTGDASFSIIFPATMDTSWLNFGTGGTPLFGRDGTRPLARATAAEIETLEGDWPYSNGVLVDSHAEILTPAKFDEAICHQPVPANASLALVLPAASA